MTYEGWANYQTWNVALWINNEESIYTSAIRYARAHSDPTYLFFVENVLSSEEGDVTPDRVSWTDPTLDYERLDEMFQELKETA